MTPLAWQYGVSPVVIRLARAIYEAQAEAHGLVVPPFDTLVAIARAPFIESATDVIVSFHSHPRGRLRVAKVIKARK